MRRCIDVWRWARRCALLCAFDRARCVRLFEIARIKCARRISRDPCAVFAFSVQCVPFSFFWRRILYACAQDVHTISANNKVTQLRFDSFSFPWSLDLWSRFSARARKRARLRTEHSARVCALDHIFGAQYSSCCTHTRLDPEAACTPAMGTSHTRDFWCRTWSIVRRRETT